MNEMTETMAIQIFCTRAKPPLVGLINPQPFFVFELVFIQCVKHGKAVPVCISAITEIHITLVTFESGEYIPSLPCFYISHATILTPFPGS